MVVRFQKPAAQTGAFKFELALKFCVFSAKIFILTLGLSLASTGASRAQGLLDRDTFCDGSSQFVGDGDSFAVRAGDVFTWIGGPISIFIGGTNTYDLDDLGSGLIAKT